MQGVRLGMEENRRLMGIGKGGVEVDRTLKALGGKGWGDMGKLRQQEIQNLVW